MPPRLGEALDALLADDQTGDEALDERLLDALAVELAAAQAAAPPGSTTAPLAPRGWDRLAARLPLATPPPGADLDWDAVAAAYVDPTRVGPARAGAPAAADPAPAAQEPPRGADRAAQDPRPAPLPANDPPVRGRGRWAVLASGAVLTAAVALFLLRPAPWTIHPDELRAPRLPTHERGQGGAGPALQAITPGPGPQQAGLIELHLRVESTRVVDQASLRLRSLRGEGRALRPATGPTWPRPDELRVGLRLPPGVHPIEVSVMDDLQREGLLVVELEVR
jgi:hypothetical protein